ncbi:Hsp20/alpha crystallin family protein [Bacillus cihuensis]|uniref:Hsp20/alpha crystallin family protein n=1 Tax=Bacillus cihuensis TaxID=1208599 RepID=UPI000404D5F1|nr:Hsp20/alpha crystallin family protein [Bacillus cihuensis]
MSDSEKRKKPFRHEGVYDFFNKMDRLFADKPAKGMLQSMNEFFGSVSSGSFPVDVSETESDYFISASLPGIRRKNIDIEILPQAVTIRILRDKQQTVANKDFYSTRKKQSTSLTRTISLSKPIDEQKVTAHHRDGILRLTIPKIKGKTIIVDD